MTRDEIRNMPAGREMDALIAERVLDLDVNGDRVCGKGFIKNMNVRLLPHYSTNMSAAWEVVEKIKDWGEGWCPQIYWDDNDGLEPGEWVAEFNKYWEAENDYRHFEAVADTAPLAICCAALLTTIKEE